MNVVIPIEDALDEVEIPSKTYFIDWNKKRIIGKCDSVTALQQAIHKSLITSRGDFAVLYSDDYGSDIENALLGESVTPEYLNTVIPTLIRDCLLEDDRINDVFDIEVTQKEDELYISCIVSSDFGDLKIEEVV